MRPSRLRARAARAARKKSVGRAGVAYLPQSRTVGNETSSARATRARCAGGASACFHRARVRHAPLEVEPGLGVGGPVVVHVELECCDRTSSPSQFTSVEGLMTPKFHELSLLQRSPPAATTAADKKAASLSK